MPPMITAQASPAFDPRAEYLRQMRMQPGLAGRTNGDSQGRLMPMGGGPMLRGGGGGFGPRPMGGPIDPLVDDTTSQLRGGGGGLMPAGAGAHLSAVLRSLMQRPGGVAPGVNVAGVRG